MVVLQLSVGKKIVLIISTRWIMLGEPMRREWCKAFFRSHWWRSSDAMMRRTRMRHPGWWRSTWFSGNFDDKVEVSRCIGVGIDQIMGDEDGNVTEEKVVVSNTVNDRAR